MIVGVVIFMISLMDILEESIYKNTCPPIYAFATEGCLLFYNFVFYGQNFMRELK